MYDDSCDVYMERCGKLQTFIMYSHARTLDYRQRCQCHMFASFQLVLCSDVNSCYTLNYNLWSLYSKNTVFFCPYHL